MRSPPRARKPDPRKNVNAATGCDSVVISALRGAEAALHRRRRARRRGEDSAHAGAGETLRRPERVRDRRGEPLPGELLPGPQQVRLPDPALLSAQPVQAATGAVQQDLFSQATVSDYLFANERIFASIPLD